MATGKPSCWSDSRLKRVCPSLPPIHLCSCDLHSISKRWCWRGAPGPPSTSFSLPGHTPACTQLSSLLLPPHSPKPWRGIPNRALEISLCLHSTEKTLMSQVGRALLQVTQPGSNSSWFSTQVSWPPVAAPHLVSEELLWKSSSTYWQGLRDTLCVRDFQGNSCGGIERGCSGDAQSLPAAPVGRAPWPRLACLEQLDFWEYSSLLCGALSWAVVCVCVCVCVCVRVCACTRFISPCSLQPGDPRSDGEEEVGGWVEGKDDSWWMRHGEKETCQKQDPFKHFLNPYWDTFWK